MVAACSPAGPPRSSLSRPSCSEVTDACAARVPGQPRAIGSTYLRCPKNSSPLHDNLGRNGTIRTPAQPSARRSRRLVSRCCRALDAHAHKLQSPHNQNTGILSDWNHAYDAVMLELGQNAGQLFLVRLCLPASDVLDFRYYGLYCPKVWLPDLTESRDCRLRHLRLLCHHNFSPQSSLHFADCKHLLPRADSGSCSFKRRKYLYLDLSPTRSTLIVYL
jgi:hypothetical protein